MAADHPLAAKNTVRLRDCASYPVGLPTAQYGVRHLIDLALVKSSVSLRVVLDADHFEFLRRYPVQEHMVTFQIPIGLPADPEGEGAVFRPIDTRDVPEGRLYLCQLRGRTLPVAAAKFAAQIGKALDARYD
jgi:hypothetical protein